MNDTIDANNKIRALILEELESHERFRLWVEANYQIHIAVDDETKAIGVKVIEEDMAHAAANLSRAVNEILESREPTIEIAGAGALKQLDKLGKA